MLLYWILLPIVWVLAHILFRFEVIGRENLKAVRDGRAYVIAPNHIANLDPVLIAITIFDWKRLRILAKEELFKNPLAGWFLRCMGAVSIERGKGDTTTVEKLTNECKNGTGIMIFPEGTRTKTGKLGVIKSGAFVIAAAAGADMLPVRIIYGTKDGRLHLFCKLRIVLMTTSMHSKTRNNFYKNLHRIPDAGFLRLFTGFFDKTRQFHLFATHFFYRTDGQGFLCSGHSHIKQTPFFLDILL